MLNDLPTERITAALRFLAAEARMSQDKIAAAVNLSQSSVGRRLHGDTALTIVDLDAIANALGYEVTVSFREKQTAAVAA